MIKHNSHIKEVTRRHTYRTNVNKDYRLDMAERVTNFPEDFFENFLKNLKQEDFIAYPCNYHLDLLHKKIAVYNKMDIENIFVSNGSCSVIKTIFELTCDKNSNVVTTEPSFPMYEVYGKMLGAAIKKVAYGEDLKISLQSIKEAIDNKTKLVILANPNSPIGDWKGEGEIEELLAFLGEKRILLLLDEAYVDYAPHTMADKVKTNENLVVVRTLSKAFGGAGCRVGYAIGTKEVICLLKKIVDPYAISQASVKFALHLFDHLHLVKKYVLEVKNQKDLIIKKLQEKGYDVVAGFCNWIHFNDKDNNHIAESILDKYGICYRKNVSIPHDDRDNWIRLTVTSDASEKNYIKNLLEE